jgi:hypothetical protein
MAYYYIKHSQSAASPSPKLGKTYWSHVFVCFRACCIHVPVLQWVGAGNLVSMYYEQGLLEYAILHYKQALLLDSNFLEAYNNLVH